jgi:hypothetical protein
LTNILVHIPPVQAFGGIRYGPWLACLLHDSLADGHGLTTDIGLRVRT